MKKTGTLLLIAGFVALLLIFSATVSAIEKPHWAQKYVEKMVEDKVIDKLDKGFWDKEADSEAIVKSLDLALKKPSGLDAAKPLRRADIIKAAVDGSQWALELDLHRHPAWCMSNDELSIPEEFVPYFNLAYKPKYNLLTHKKGRLTAWDKEMTYAELAYLSYHLLYPPNTKPGQQLIIVTTSEPETLNPYSTASMPTSYINAYASWGGDVSFGDDAVLYPFQLTRVPTVDNGDIRIVKDPVTGRIKEVVRYNIRKGMYNCPMYDGEPEKLHEVTADDYLFTMRVSVVPRIQAVSKSGMWKIDSIKKIDRYTIEVVWNEVYTYATWGWGDTYKSMFELDLFTAPQDFGTRDDFIDYTNGPYKMAKWDRGNQIEFVPNPHSLYAQPLVDRILIKFMSDNNTIKLNLKSGSVDCAGLSPKDYNDLKDELLNYRFIFTEATSWSHIDLNLFKPNPKEPDKPALFWAFGDKRVRQAMLYALDREKINQIANHGIYSVAHSWMSPKSKFYSEEKIKKYPFDPAKAEKLLDEAGWKLAKIGNEIVRCKDGDPKKPFRFKFKTNSENDVAIQIAEMVKNMLGRVGLIIDPLPVTSKELLGQGLVRHEWEMITFAWVSNPIRPSASLFMERSIPTADNGWSGQNLVGWEGGKEHEKICEEMEQEIPDAKLQDLINRELEIWTEELPNLPMFNVYNINVCPPNLENYKPTGSNKPTSWNAAFWYREEK